MPIGSGLIESSHRHVLQARLKKAGAAWLADHADQIAHLRGLRANRQWASFWSYPHPLLTIPGNDNRILRKDTPLGFRDSTTTPVKLSSEFRSMRLL